MEAMKTKKDKRNSGRKITKIYHPEIYPYEEEKWDDWDDYRDGFRQIGKDRTKITNVSIKNYQYRVWNNLNLIDINKKNKIQLKVRKAKKTKINRDKL